MTENINFEKISGNQRQKNILFKLLKRRKYKISHSQIPNISLHNNFVENHPYRAWFIIFDNKENIELILNFIKSNFLPQNEVSSLIPPYFYLNISRDNFQLQGILDEMEISKLQVSYKI